MTIRTRSDFYFVHGAKINKHKVISALAHVLLHRSCFTTGCGLILLVLRLFRLQDEYVHIEGEFKSTIEEAKLAQEKHNNIVNQLRKELSAKQSECDDLRNQVQ